jgi:hypothetical protein
LQTVVETQQIVSEKRAEITAPSPASNTETTSNEPKVSALSLSSIRAKRALEESNKAFVKEVVDLPTEPFSETEMLVQWTKYAKRLGDKGFKIMESLLLINDPVLI